MTPAAVCTPHAVFAVLSECRVEVEESVWLPFKTTAQLPEDTLVEWWHRPEKPDKQERHHRDRVKERRACEKRTVQPDP